MTENATQATVALRDSRTVVIRPLEEQDREALLAFGRALPQDDLLYLEDDFTSAEIVNRMVNAAQAENWRQIVAVADDKIVGYSAARRLHGWSSHVADLVLVVDANWRGSGVGRHLAQAIFGAARQLGAAKVIIEMLDEQRGGKMIFERLGFHVEGHLSAHARDRSGHRHDLLILAYHVTPA